MPDIDYTCYDLYIAIFRQKGDAPVHWALLMAHPGAVRCTWFHTVGCPGYYERAVEPAKHFDSWSIEEKHFVAQIPSSQEETVFEQAAAIPAQSCQCYVSYLIFRLEQRDLIEAGTYEYWRDNYVESRREGRGPGCLGEF
ncbi:hypothetical protein N7456_005693 [Penicillium angulare]|uniref:Uncharacterized protein n=1 Tax=Penicillium angulare TaxID=116970 RepID=A0A9W9KKS1_9EURO|nr:hypothetical protein N7456_005693 [Penicillium angulare]